MKTIVLGLGNPILGDDSAGWCIAGEIRQQLTVGDLSPTSEIEVDCLAVGGLALMERLIGYDRAILIDAMQTGVNPPGTLYCFPFEDLPDRSLGHLSSAHDTTLRKAIEVGRMLGAHLPGEISIVAIEAEKVLDFSQELSPAVAAAVPGAIKAVIRLLGERDEPCEVRQVSGTKALRRLS